MYSVNLRNIWRIRIEYLKRGEGDFQNAHFYAVKSLMLAKY